MSNTNEVTCLSIEGDFTIFTATALQQRFLDALSTGTELEVDLTQVSEIDSAGIQLMVAAKREAAARNKSIRFTGHSAAVLDVIALYELSGHFDEPALIHSHS